MSSVVASGRIERDERQRTKLPLDICKFEQSVMLDMSSRNLWDHWEARCERYVSHWSLSLASSR
jgi:hypothetical protein